MANWAETYNVRIIRRDECLGSVNFNTSQGYTGMVRSKSANLEKYPVTCQGLWRLYMPVKCSHRLFLD